MNTKASLRIATNDDRSANATGAASTGLTTIIGALVVMACFAAPLLLTLPDTMNTATGPTPMIREAAAADMTSATFHERHPVQPGVNWADSMEQSALAQWRMRASD